MSWRRWSGDCKECEVTDPLTGLMNRREMERQIESRRAAGVPPVLLQFQLSGEINDQVAKQVAARLGSQFRHKDFVSRWTDTDFLVLFQGPLEIALGARGTDRAVGGGEVSARQRGQRADRRRSEARSGRNGRVTRALVFTSQYPKRPWMDLLELAHSAYFRHTGTTSCNLNPATSCSLPLSSGSRLRSLTETGAADSGAESRFDSLRRWPKSSCSAAAWPAWRLRLRWVAPVIVFGCLKPGRFSAGARLPIQQALKPSTIASIFCCDAASTCSISMNAWASPAISSFTPNMCSSSLAAAAASCEPACFPLRCTLPNRSSR